MEEFVFLAQEQNFLQSSSLLKCVRSISFFRQYVVDISGPCMYFLGLKMILENMAIGHSLILNLFLTLNFFKSLLLLLEWKIKNKNKIK